MVAGLLDDCPFCRKPLRIAAASRMSLEQLDATNEVLPLRRFGNNTKVTDMHEWLAGKKL